ncbi:sarcosine oxidase subunit gamma family protein [Aliiroseovarius sp. F47248L]|uniref:sarcosine oxidase subunit gamma n=1 Tax=Aliiroseovarius sp. F47248L TaxID=2926420 RepID=UPI001FF60293|nr:sarcosine oxidase subunit gamma family protein [Aliiroseovarius sp. F47248L]MCK0139084.1 sarcosine oxidase subunit gamma family protein [Aliiroseovarius sp. F47248L]
MSNAVSALQGASFDGYCKVEEAGLVGMITLRGDLSSEGVAKTVKTATGAEMPGQGQITEGAKGRAGWMSPDELLLIVDHAKAADVVEAASKSLAKEHALVVNVSDARAVYRVKGAVCREVIAKLTPADTSVMQPGMLRRTRIAQIPAAFYLEDDETAVLVCFRSVAQYAFDLLKDAAKPGGEVFG